MTAYNGRQAKAARIRRSRGVPGFIPTADVAAHVRALRDSGWSRRRIAVSAGVHENTVKGIVLGYRPTVQYGTAVAILALKASDAPSWSITPEVPR